VAAITLSFDGYEIICLQFMSNVRMQTRSESCQELTLFCPRALICGPANYLLRTRVSLGGSAKNRDKVMSLKLGGLKYEQCAQTYIPVQLNNFCIRNRKIGITVFTSEKKI